MRGGIEALDLSLRWYAPTELDDLGLAHVSDRDGRLSSSVRRKPPQTSTSVIDGASRTPFEPHRLIRAAGTAENGSSLLNMAPTGTRRRSGLAIQTRTRALANRADAVLLTFAPPARASPFFRLACAGGRSREISLTARCKDARHASGSGRASRTAQAAERARR